MKIRHIVLMLIYNSDNGTIRSKTLLQKEMYFLALKMRKDFSYKAHYYGPYSPEVEQSLDELVSIGLVEQNRQRLGDNGRGFEIQRFDYSITDQGKEMVNYLLENEEVRKINDIIFSFIDNLKKVDSLDYLNLSLAAKTYYILSKDKSSMTKEKFQDTAKKLNWKLHPDDIHIAKDILGKLGFIEQ